MHRKASEAVSPVKICELQVSSANIEYFGAIFSSAGYAYDELRQNILPAKLEQQLFLKFNKKFWDLTLVNDLVNLSE